MTNPQTKNCQNCKQDFVIDVEDLKHYEEIKVPSPTFCPECRAIRRLISRNLRKLYKRKDAHGKTVFSIYPEEHPFIVYDRKYWLSDAWDAIEYGRDYDFSRPFFEQYFELTKAVPWPHTLAVEMINSDYSIGGWLKNCYLCFNAGYDEDCAYGQTIRKCKNCIDTDFADESELCYESSNLGRSYKNFFSIDCGDCQNVWFSMDMANCSDCFGCSGLRNKKYHIFNKPYSKEEYQGKMKGFDLASRKSLKEHKAKAQAFWKTMPKRYMNGFQNPGSSGNYIYNATNIKHSFFVSDAKDCSYVQLCVYPPQEKLVDSTFVGIGAVNTYETTQTGLQLSNVKFAQGIVTCMDVEYVMNCWNSQDLFGCVGLRNKKYCILNKEYSKEEYEKLVPKIKQHMMDMPYTDQKGRVYKYGEFFPMEIGPHAYNETAAWEFFPITKEEAETKGYPWRDMEKESHQPTIVHDQIPDRAEDIKDDITKEILECAHKGECNQECSRAFRIIPQELDFYKKMNLPLPDLCSNCRHAERMKYMNPMRLWSRQCRCDYEVYQNETKHQHHPEGRCPNNFETSYAPEKPEIIYCEQCYQAEVA